MTFINEVESRAARAKALAASESFADADQIAWASLPRGLGPAPSASAIDALSNALVDAVERGACPEFVCSLLVDGANAEVLSDDDLPLWRNAAHVDARRPVDERCCWMIVAKLALGPGFLRDPRLPAVKEASAACVGELEALLRAQDEHFDLHPDGQNSSEFYAVHDARHDCAVTVLLASMAELRAGARKPKAPGGAS